MSSTRSDDATSDDHPRRLDIQASIESAKCVVGRAELRIENARLEVRRADAGVRRARLLLERYDPDGSKYDPLNRSPW
jgi:hypothetical protein